jgi:plasmid replication initiation protein
MPKKTEMVTKSNRLIEASYRLGLNEQRLILYAISRCREEQRGFSPGEPITITVEGFAKQFPSVGMGTIYQKLKEALDSLFDRFVTLYDTAPDTGEDRVTKTRWISTATYLDGTGRLQFIFAPIIIQYITRLEPEFTRYRLDMVGNMSSAHAVRLYELLVQYRAAGKRELSLAELRMMFQLAPTEYKLTANFINRVIAPSVEQINEHTDLTVSYKTKKTGKAISHFAFKIKNKDGEQPDSEVTEDQGYRNKLEANGQQRLDGSNEAF